MDLTLLGTGAGIPQPGRAQSSILIREDRMLLIDCGAGALLRIGELGINPLDLDAVILSHLHLDHVSDLLPLAKARYLLGEPWLRVYGPAGTKHWLVSLQALYPYLNSMRLEVNEIDAGSGLDVNGFEVSSASTIHSVPSLCYRIEGGSVITYSGDTEPTASVCEIARGSDLLIHECSFPDGLDVTNHTTPSGLGRLIRDVKEIVLTHFYPHCNGLEESMARRVEEISGIKTVAGRDLMSISIRKI